MKRGRCVGAGMSIRDWSRSVDGNRETVFFPENVAGYVRKDDLVVPHSELAMHVRAAGRPLVAWSCRGDGRGCAVVFEEADGGCGFTSGLPGEVLEIGLRQAMQRLFHYRMGLGGLRRRRR